MTGKFKLKDGLALTNSTLYPTVNQSGQKTMLKSEKINAICCFLSLQRFARMENTIRYAT